MTNGNKTIIAVAAVIAIVSAVTLTPWVLSVAWAMTAVKFFGLPHITLAQAMMLMLLVRLVRGESGDDGEGIRKPGDSAETVAGKLLSRSVVAPLFALAFIWLLSNWA